MWLRVCFSHFSYLLHSTSLWSCLRMLFIYWYTTTTLFLQLVDQLIVRAIYSIRSLLSKSPLTKKKSMESNGAWPLFAKSSRKLIHCITSINGRFNTSEQTTLTFTLPINYESIHQWLLCLFFHFYFPFSSNGWVHIPEWRWKHHPFVIIAYCQIVQMVLLDRIHWQG